MAQRNDPNQLSPELKKYRSRGHATDLYVAPNGGDKWTGSLPEPDGYGSDGPFRSIDRAIDHLRRHPTPGPVTVWLRGGRYELTAPITLSAADSGDVRFAAFPGEEVVFDGGARVTGWRAGDLDGRAVWIADVRAELAETGITQLFVNGERRPRPTLPREGFYHMQHVADTPLQGFMAGPVSDTFVCAPGDVQAWRNLPDIDIVAYHYWNEERLPIATFDPQTNTVVCTRPSAWPLKDDAAPAYARYRVENVREALSAPGEWYFDRPEGRIYYVPRAGETLDATEFYVPRLAQLLVMRGDGEAGRPLQGITFEGITFRHTTWACVGNRGSCEQAAWEVPAVIELAHTRNCAVRDCTIEHVGMYGIALGHGCRANRIAANCIRDMGAGGVKLMGGDEAGPRADANTGNVVSDNEIADGGHVYASAVGILVIHSSANELVHNHIHGLEYSGISCGWVWGYGANPTHDNRIEKNHIHHLGTGLLNDMGGIYILGEQPGTSLRGNHIHHIRVHNYGGWAIYCDEGTSWLVIEGNVLHDTDSELLQLHYGKYNIVRHNVFAFSKRGHVSLNVVGGEDGFLLLHNLIVADDCPALLARNRESLRRRGFSSDLNLFWDVSGKPTYSADQYRNAENKVVNAAIYSLDDLQALGYDRHSICADPLCADLAARDFRLTPDSPAHSLGIPSPDISDVGPRAPSAKRATPNTQS